MDIYCISTGAHLYSCSITGPGPGRYGLPATVGYSTHDPTKKKAPAYSFGARLENTSE